MLNASLRGSEAKAVLFQGPFQRFSSLWASDLPAALQVRVHAPAPWAQTHAWDPLQPQQLQLHSACVFRTLVLWCSDDEHRPCPGRITPEAQKLGSAMLAGSWCWLATAICAAAYGPWTEGCMVGAGVLGAGGRCTARRHPRRAWPGQV